MKQSLHVEVQGHGDTIVLLHGWGFHGGIWDSLAAQLSSHFRVVRPDLPGHGHSPLTAGNPQGDYDLDSIVDALVEVVDAPAVWVGWSLGSMFVLRAAMRHPQQVRGVVTMAGTPCFTSRDDWQHGVMRGLIDRFGDELTGDWQTTLRHFIALQGQGCDPRLLRQVRKVMMERLPSPEGLRGALKILRDGDLRAELKDVQCPLLAIHGVKDNLVPLRGAQSWMGSVRDARLLAFKDAGHVPFMSHPQDVLQAIHGFASYQSAALPALDAEGSASLELEAG